MEPFLSWSAYEEYLGEVRSLVLEEIQRIVPATFGTNSGLYDLVLDYPLREGKGIRPALCLAMCRALGGHAEAALPTAAVLELFHNAFLIHDDVEDGSLLRRNLPTLFAQEGMSTAINVGDAMLAMALSPLLENTRVVGLGKALKILALVARMARESAEGQAIELGWIKRDQWQISDRDYLRMIHKKSGWYTFIAPLLSGAILGGAAERFSRRLGVLATNLGLAFQIQDDLLSLTEDATMTGKDRLGDLWEGKRTLMLLHFARSLEKEELEGLGRLLSQARSHSGPPTSAERLRIDRLMASARHRGWLTSDQSDLLFREMLQEVSPPELEKKISDLVRSMENRGSLAYARRLAARYGSRAHRTFLNLKPFLGPSVHREFIAKTVQYVCDRRR